MSDITSKIDSTIKYSFYLLFFLVPLIMWPSTYELFEFNKMWVVFVITVFIAFLWAAKMIIQGRIEIRRTPLDIPIAFFLLAHIISTFISIDPHTSLWGYYSRFNGGLFSMIAYITLYYAFATNLVSNGDEEKSINVKLLVVSLFSGLAVALWGLPSHFGFDPTCFAFRGTFDVSCWTEQFQPTIRIFSTLGQPNWMGTFLAVLTPISIGFGIYKLTENRKNLLVPSLLMGLTFAFFLSILWTRSQSSFLGLAVGMILFLILYLGRKIISQEKTLSQVLKQKSARYVVGAAAIFIVTAFFVGTPISSINRLFTLDGIKSTFTKAPEPEAKTTAPEGFSDSPTIAGGTESSKIRLIVWNGAIELFKKNPIFGTGVETYAYAYYGVKPVAHNLTSEWDYLYNKAHNEYLNYLATTGAFGLASYLLIIVFFYYKTLRGLLSKRSNKYNPIVIGILGGYTALLVSNFFGFSVVILNLFFFLLPVISLSLQNPSWLGKSFILLNKLSDEKALGMGRMSLLLLTVIIALFLEIQLINFWFADQRYALGYNLNKAGEFTQAYTPLTEAVSMAPNEDLYKDELSINMATLAVLLAQQNQATQAAQFASQANAISEEIVKKHPNNVVFLKTRTRVTFALSQIDPAFINNAIATITQARKLAPTDAKIVYNMALFYNQKGENARAIELFGEAIKLKPNYADPYYARALLLTQLAETEPTRAQELNMKAKEDLEYILKNIDPQNSPAKELLETL